MPVDLQRVFAVHGGGKIAIAPRCAVRGRADLSLVYTPGVAHVPRSWPPAGATSRTQINNVLCFPGFFRGLLDAGATQVTEQMKLAAAAHTALAGAGA